MLDLIALILIVMLIGIAFWLQDLIDQSEGELSISSSLIPEVTLKGQLRQLPSKTMLRIEHVKERLKTLTLFLLRIGVYISALVFLVVSIYSLVAWFTTGVLPPLLIMGLLAGLTLFLLIWWIRAYSVGRRYLEVGPYAHYGVPRYELERSGQEKIGFTGTARIPTKIYEGDSCNITLDLYPSIRNVLGDAQPIKVQKQKEGLSLTLTLSSHTGEKEYLEIELIGAGFSVEGEKKQKQLLTYYPLLRYQWNCLFQNSGTHSFLLVFRIISPSDTIELGRIEQKIRVTKLDHLTQRQVWILATSAGILSGGLAMAEVIHKLGLW